MKRILKALDNALPIQRSEREQGFKFLDPGKLDDGELELVLFRKLAGKLMYQDVPTYRFVMRRVGKSGDVGRIDLRVGNTERIVMYLGHIGYRVNHQYRGNRYAARATSLLLPLARRHGLEKLWITCDPDNLASRRTCELVGGKLKEIVDVPENTDTFRAGERRKCRYLLDLRTTLDMDR